MIDRSGLRIHARTLIRRLAEAVQVMCAGVWLLFLAIAVLGLVAWTITEDWLRGADRAA